jgi:hypothetical protein
MHVVNFHHSLTRCRTSHTDCAPKSLRPHPAALQIKVLGSDLGVSRDDIIGTYPWSSSSSSRTHSRTSICSAHCHQRDVSVATSAHICNRDRRCPHILRAHAHTRTHTHTHAHTHTHTRTHTALTPTPLFDRCEIQRVLVRSAEYRVGVVQQTRVHTATGAWQGLRCRHHPIRR